jgi:hypothetical protein
VTAVPPELPDTVQPLKNGKSSKPPFCSSQTTSAAPVLAASTGHDYMGIDMEHGAFTVQEATQLCIAALATGMTPIVRVCAGAIDEATRLLDNGARWGARLPGDLKEGRAGQSCARSEKSRGAGCSQRIAPHGVFNFEQTTSEADGNLQYRTCASNRSLDSELP